MKAISKVFLSLLFLLLLVAGAIYVLLRLALAQAFMDEAVVTQFEKASLEDLKRVKQIAIQVSEQGSLQDNQARTIELSDRDINLAIAQFGPRQVDIPKDTFAKVQLHLDYGTVTASGPVSELIQPLLPELESRLASWQLGIANHFIAQIEDRWLNLSVPVKIEGESPAIKIAPGAISIGTLTLSDAISQTIYEHLHSEAKQQRGYSQAIAAWKNIRTLKIEDELVKASFVLPSNNRSPLNSYQNLVLSEDEVELIAVYEEKLASIAQRGPLSKALSELFSLARDRSESSADPVAENRAALLALSKLYGGDQIATLIDQRDRIAALRMPKPYTIYRRSDLAQHWVLSSGASLLADETIAELIGVDKELSDLMGGSTISAWDLLADKAGILLAQKATKNAKSAREIQIALSQVRRDADILPNLGPDFSGTNDRFSSSELDELNEMVELYLQQHRLYR